MERVNGIGGVFFRARDPEALTEWYVRHLGIADPDNPAAPWRQQAGLTVWSGFAADTSYFGRQEQQWMVNFRVSDLDAMLARCGPPMWRSWKKLKTPSTADSAGWLIQRATESNCGSHRSRNSPPTTER